jgi:probable rRNA maturation factor
MNDAAPQPAGDDLELEFDVALETAPPPDLDLDAWPRLARYVLGEEGQHGAWVVAAALVGDERIREMHRDFMGIDTATDVITFPAAAPDEPPSGGDIAISVDRAAAQAPDFCLSPADEATFLLVHGLLHLCGWDDATPDDRQRMLDRGRALLDRFAQIPADS